MASKKGAIDSRQRGNQTSHCTFNASLPIASDVTDFPAYILGECHRQYLFTIAALYDLQLYVQFNP
jgi:hypothetical protein